MKVFISWSGEASRRVAELLRIFLPCMMQDLEPFMSQHDLSSGARWSEQLAKALDASNFGIVCLTPDNLNSPWILFEAGALTKHVEGRACCLLFSGLGPADVSGPLSQFQNCVFSPDGFKRLLADMNNLLEKPLGGNSLQMIFEKWWTDLDRQVSETLALSGQEVLVKERRDQADILEELLVRMRAVQRNLDASSAVVQRPLTETEYCLAVQAPPLTDSQMNLFELLYRGAEKNSPVDLSGLNRRQLKEDYQALRALGLVEPTLGGRYRLARRYFDHVAAGGALQLYSSS